MPYVEASIVIKADADAVYRFAKEQEKFPQYMRDVESVKVLERRESSQMSEWVTSVEGTPIIWIEEDVFDDKNRKITYRLTEGDLDKFEGFWTFTPSSEGTRVVLAVDFDFGIPHLEELIGPTLQTKVRENSDMMLTGIKQFFEGGK
ncbi:MAG: SRPBCC family protein [Candidatus Eremiobacteraeota bacterium]|nr:SRPBCC family protein [Candidatus Eremiobacteraeota bacterium]